MSIDYYAAATREEAALLSAVGGDDAHALPALAVPDLLGRLSDALPSLVPFKKDYTALAEMAGCSEDEARSRFPGTERNWEKEEDRGYVQVVVYPTHVVVHMGGGESSVQATQDVLEALGGAGLAVYDPQQESWL